MVNNLQNFKADVDAHTSLKSAIENAKGQGPLTLIKNLLDFIKNKLSSSKAADIYKQLTTTSTEINAKLKTLKEQQLAEEALIVQSQQGEPIADEPGILDKIVSKAKSTVENLKSIFNQPEYDSSEWQNSEKKYLEQHGADNPNETSEPRGDFSSAFAPEGE